MVTKLYKPLRKTMFHIEQKWENSEFYMNFNSWYKVTINFKAQFKKFLVVSLLNSWWNYLEQIFRALWKWNSLMHHVLSHVIADDHVISVNSQNNPIRWVSILD